MMMMMMIVGESIFFSLEKQQTHILISLVCLAVIHLHPSVEEGNQITLEEQVIH